MCQAPCSEPSRKVDDARPTVTTVGRLTRFAVKAPIHVYRWTLKPIIGMECRHEPTCSAYALDAIEINGTWRGLWLAISRIWRCSPWGTAGLDPPPDIRTVSHPLAPWRYGLWSQQQTKNNHRGNK